MPFFVQTLLKNASVPKPSVTFNSKLSFIDRSIAHKLYDDALSDNNIFAVHFISGGRLFHEFIKVNSMSLESHRCPERSNEHKAYGTFKVPSLVRERPLPFHTVTTSITQ
jgi:hypothetical protein